MSRYDLRGLNSKELSREEIIKRLREMLDDERFTHSVAVSQLAVELAKRHGCDPAKAELAGLVHDCAKCMPPALLIEKIRECEIKLDEIERRYPALWHPIVSACVAKDEFGVEDEEILKAIRLHTTGDGRMSLLDKIIYVADYADPTRGYPESEKIRRLAFENLNRALLETTKQKIIYVLSKGEVMIHPKTIAAHNSAVEIVISERQGG